MFSKHITSQISAYCHGELTAEQSRSFSEHIIGCAKCRVEYEHIKRGVEFAEQISLLKAPDNLWDQIAPLLESARSENFAPRRFTRIRKPIFAIAAVLLLAFSFGLYRLTRNSNQQVTQSNTAWNVERLDGAPKIGTSTIGSKGQLNVGQWLETDNNSKAQIDVSSIGRVQIDPNTRVKLVQTQPTEHRLELAKGKMSAQIWAPPRLFFVDTPSAVAADLGCAYTLEVDDEGRGLLRVTTGWVALELKDRESMVPAGAACETRPGVGPGTPYFEDASEEFRRHLEAVDFGSPTANNSDLKSLLAMSRQRDLLTLWHLLSRVEGGDRDLVFDRIADFVAPPHGVTREGILNLDHQMLDSWREQLEPAWESKAPVTHPLAETYWQVRNGITRHLNKKLNK